MTHRMLFDAALKATETWHASLPAARQFCRWPSDIVFKPRPSHTIRATKLIQSEPGQMCAVSAPLVRALQALSPYLEWRHTYTADQVGQHFLDSFGWFELAGPDGHFVTHQTRITVGYWGPGLEYGRHYHRAEELYTVLSGHATFKADAEEDQDLGPEGCRLHISNQPHAMSTRSSPVLALVFWRGQGLADAPKMSAA